MKAALLPCLGIFLAAAAAPAAGPTDDALNRAVVDYGERLRAANEELARTRERIAKEQTPLLLAIRAGEDRIVAAETEIARLNRLQENSAEIRGRLMHEAETLHKNDSYLATVAHDSLGSYVEGILPGERAVGSARILQLQEEFGEHPDGPANQRALDVARFLLARTNDALGGAAVPGEALIEGDNRMVKGTFVLAGPETFFRADENGVAGTVRGRGESDHAVMYPLPKWNAAAAAEFFQGRMGLMEGDATAGKALRLREAKGTVLEHINRGGLVSYAILAVGLAALLLIVLKARDLVRLDVGSPAAAQRFLDTLANGAPEESQAALRQVGASTREVFAAGLRYLGASRMQLEERLNGVLLRQRLEFERRLPLLAVIATAAPLMGLLGTVTGMVRTFALITVFGTGNAGKLASGISEVLVATELGLMVAIPTLIAHGFLAHRIQRKLGMIEHQAAEFMAAVAPDESREKAEAFSP